MNRLHATPDTTFPQQSLVQPVKTYTSSIFKGHRLQVEKYQDNHLSNHQPDWIPALLIGFFILVAWAQLFYYKRMKQIMLAPLSKRFLNQLIRDGNLFKERISVALSIVYVLAFSLLIFQTNEILLNLSAGPFHGFLLFLITAAMFTAFWLSKILVINFLGFVFKTHQTAREYLLNMLIFSLISAIALLPLLVFVIYTKSVLFLYGALITISLLYLFRFVRGFFIGITLTKFSYLFLIVYLCTLEILPLLILAKLLLNYIHSTTL